MVSAGRLIQTSSSSVLGCASRAGPGRPRKGDDMKKLVTRVLFAALVVSVASFAFAGDTADGSWTGVITDTSCGEKGAKAGHADCAAKCVKEHGAKYALYTPT